MFPLIEWFLILHIPAAIASTLPRPRLDPTVEEDGVLRAGSHPADLPLVKALISSAAASPVALLNHVRTQSLHPDPRGGQNCTLPLSPR